MFGKGNMCVCAFAGAGASILPVELAEASQAYHFQISPEKHRPPKGKGGRLSVPSLFCFSDSTTAALTFHRERLFVNKDFTDEMVTGTHQPKLMNICC